MYKKLLLSAVLLVGVLSNVTPIGIKANEKSVGNTYYVSSISGDNNNDGTSENEAWQTLDKVNELTLGPGDEVKLENGSSFQNQYLHVKGSGAKDAPIMISNYGDETKGKPSIDTNGEGVWYQNYGKALDSSSHKYKDYVSSSILLYDVEYVEVKGIAVTNEPLEVDAKYNVVDYMNRTGVAVVSQNKGTLDHVYLEGLEVKNVYGNVYDKHMNNGGIYFTTFMPKDESKTGIARYNDILVKGCHVENVNRWGIALAYTAYHDKFTGKLLDDSIMSKYGATNVLIEGNYVKDPGGDAITTMYCDRPIVQNNISDGAARQINTSDYAATGSGRVAAAIWPWKCKDATFQYNEVFDTCNNQDGQAWDADSGDGTIYQYNYSHNNSGGAVMFCLGESVNNTFRYNISYEDLGGVINPTGNPDAHIYNNTFILKEGVDFIRQGMAKGNMIVENNIIYNNGETKAELWNKEERDYTYHNNLYYGFENTPVEDKKAISQDPLFVGNIKDAPLATNDKIAHPRSAYEMFKIKDTSPAVNKGIYVNGHARQDFFGNKVGRVPDIGAHETNVEEDIILDIVSTLYTINGTTITNVSFATTVEQFMNNLVYSVGLTCEVLDSAGQPKSGNDQIITGDKVKIANGNDSKEYSITINEENLSVQSGLYDVRDNDINGVAKNTSVSTFLSNLSYPSTLSAKVLSQESEVGSSEIVQDGFILQVTGQSGMVKNYTIALTKVYVEYDPTTMSATDGSHQNGNGSEGPASFTLDNNMNTLWHTDWSGTTRENCWLTLDLGAAKEVSMFKYIPRSKIANGIITKYEILVSEDNATWTAVSSGNWDLSTTSKYAYFTPVKARYVKLKAIDSYTDLGLIFASAAEVRVGFEEKGE